MKEIDVFKLASELGFDVRGAELRDGINGLMIVNEHCDKIPGFDSNKVIAYNCKKDINIKRNSVAKHLNSYINCKKETEEVFLVEASEGIEPIIDINLLVQLCLEQGLISRKKNVKRLYKKM